jgi:hypothetical protein
MLGSFEPDSQVVMLHCALSHYLAAEEGHKC